MPKNGPVIIVLKRNKQLHHLDWVGQADSAVFPLLMQSYVHNKGLEFEEVLLDNKELQIYNRTDSNIKDVEMCNSVK